MSGDLQIIGKFHSCQNNFVQLYTISISRKIEILIFKINMRFDKHVLHYIVLAATPLEPLGALKG